MNNLFDTIVDCVLKGRDSHHVVLFPVGRLPDVAGAQRWGLTVATSVAGYGFRNHHIEGNDEEAADSIRSGVQMALWQAAKRHGGLVIHDCNDELAALVLCEQLWPGERVTELRQKLEAERREWATS